MKREAKEIFVEFRNRAGKRLRGMVHLPRGATRKNLAPGVVFFHGFTGDRMTVHWLFVKCARALEQAGIASLRFDFYGSGESDGEFREVTLQSELSDGPVAVDFFRRQPGVDARRVGLIGLSLGGWIAAALAARLRVQSLVLWAPLAHAEHLRALAQTAVKPIPGGDGAGEYEAWEISSLFFAGADGVDPLRALPRFEKPTLIIHPERDESVPQSHADDLLQAAGAQLKQKIVIPGADHTFSSVVWERQVIQLTVDWFRRTLSADKR